MKRHGSASEISSRSVSSLLDTISRPTKGGRTSGWPRCPTVRSSRPHSALTPVPDALLTFANGYIAAFTGRHCTSDFVIDVDGDDARSRCYLIAVNNAGAPIISTTAVYEDVLRRTADGWRFVHRKVSPDTAIH